MRFLQFAIRFSILSLFIAFIPNSLQAQNPIDIEVLDASSKEALISATISYDSTVVSTDVNGRAVLNIKSVSDVIVSYIGYVTKTITVTSSASDLKVELDLSENILETATVTGSKYETSIAKSVVSIDVLKPDLIRSNNASSIEDVLSKVAGVQINDGQADIRGGSGWAYGAGSRVMLLLDEMPAMQVDAGVPNFSDLPVENISQVEVLKGASSTLYGSSALNGIIHMRTGYAKSKPETEIGISYQRFQDYADEDKTWWNENEQPSARQFSIVHRRKIDKLDFVSSIYLFRRDSWNQNTFDERNRGTLNLRYRYSERLNFGVNVNYNDLASSDFFFWQGRLPTLITRGSNVSQRTNVRYHIDPYLSYYDKYKNRHRIKTRYHYILNDNDNNQSNESNNIYTEYQFSRNFVRRSINLSSGLVYNGNFTDSELFSDTLVTASNIASYVQADITLKEKLSLSGGLRYEYNRQNVPEMFDGVTIPDGKITDSGLIARFGLNWELADYSFLRASWGQGYRYPTVTERLIATTFGGYRIFPNINLESERAWSGEIGIKQGFSFIGLNGYIDVSRFWTEYDNMMEFTFVIIDNTQGFQSQNVGGATIEGYEINIGGQSEVFSIPIRWIGGYTYSNPRYKDFNEQLRTASSVDYNVLKYRSKESFKIDVEGEWKGFRTGISYRYVSHMLAIDNILGVLGQIKEYREANNQGYRLWDARFSYERYDVKLSFLINNFLNEEYTTRPGLLEAPRSYAIRLDYSF